MNAIEHNPVCNCTECERDLRLAAMVNADKRVAENTRRQVETATLIHFPTERTKARGEL